MARAASRAGPEPVIWLAGLVWLALEVPAAGPHLTICPFAHLGITFCPGCGLGQAAALALHGQLLASIHTHPIGIPAVFILLGRSVTLLARALHGSTVFPSLTGFRRNIHA